MMAIAPPSTISGNEIRRAALITRSLILWLILISLGILLSCKKGNPYNIKNPESVVWNPITQSYLISNAGSGYILSLKNKKEFSIFNQTQLISPKGIAICGKTLYVTNVNQLVGYSLADGKEVFRYNLPGAISLNDIAVPSDSMLYASDTGANSIVLFNLKTLQGSAFKHKELQSPNGLYFEQQDTTALLYITSFRPSAPVQILNLNSRQLTSLPNTEVSLADGILQNPDGSWLVSSWQENTIYMFKPDWSARTRIDEKVISPADIYLNPADHELCIPQFNTNQITFVAPIEPKSKAGVPAAGR